ncbi:MAG: Hpt domain-containing protein [Gemmatimonadaceae bacterium]
MTPDPQSDLAPPFDRDAFLARLQGDSTLAATLAELFLSEAPKLLEDTRHAVAAADADALYRAAHALKGSVDNFCAAPAAQAAARLELMGRTGDLAVAAAALRTLELELDRLGPALREITE